VRNRLPDNELNVTSGKVKIKDEKTNSKLEVRFAPAFLSFPPLVWGDYRIIEWAITTITLWSATRRANISGF
jgi:apolipoprotein D and lipocalin family protein